MTSHFIKIYGVYKGASRLAYRHTHLKDKLISNCLHSISPWPVTALIVIKVNSKVTTTDESLLVQDDNQMGRCLFNIKSWEQMFPY